jgi:hypothetical protein
MHPYGRIVSMTQSRDKCTHGYVFHRDGEHVHTVIIIESPLSQYGPRRIPEVAQHCAPLDVLDYLNMKRVDQPVRLSEVSRVRACVYLMRTHMTYLGVSDVPAEHQSSRTMTLGTLTATGRFGGTNSPLAHAFKEFHDTTFAPHVLPLWIGPMQYLPHDPFR